MSDHQPQTNYLDPEVLQKIGDLEFIAREVVEGLRVGSHRSQLRGFSTEFAHHRQYAPGDALRTIDWRVFGRTDRYYTKLYEAETNFDCYLLMDASASMSYASGKVSKLEYAKFLAASLAYLVLKQRDSVGLSIFDSEVLAYQPPRSTMSVILQIEKLLRDIKPVPKTSVAKQLHDVALMIKRRSFVVVISDLLADVDDVLAGLKHLRFDGHNVVVMHTLDPYELEFPFQGAWCFEGLESEEPLTTQAERIRDDYLASLNEYVESIRNGCLASQVDYTLIDTSRPLDQVLSEFVHKRQATLGGPSAGARG
ncbi:DUF58 domain-containing protein [bacterium]|nr:DUF58 domain-containing protein [Rubripirellula sp.]MDA7873841.1 DUF58 domain-containing protein [Rhodopirellula sp.]MDB4540147.1 DUF58 domain-containing protein [bacterium]MDB4644990.1 DUF58 domain-containing protein [Rubripirellula sp.]